MIKKSYFFNKKLLKNISQLPIEIRRIILVIIDFISLFITIVFANILFSQFSPLYVQQIIRDILFFSSVSIPIYLLFGQYRIITKFISKKSIYSYFLRNFFVFFILSFFINNNLGYLFTITISQTFLSFFIRNLLAYLISFSKVNNSKKIVIYGAGEAGAKLASSLILNQENEILFFVDDDTTLWSRNILGIPIKSKKELEKYQNQIDILFIAIPTLSFEEKNLLIDDLCSYPFKLMSIPSLDEILSGKSKISEARSIKLEELIFRDIAKSNKEIIKNNFQNKNILITGAGGSIGREISKQLLDANPQNLVLLDFSEFNLYSLQNTLKIKNNNSKLVFILGNCCNKNLVNKIIEKYKINSIIHCAAYKHVPLVEENPMVGLANNIISTKIISEVAIENNIEKAILISTDKAVRPTNIMGASKRVAELIFLNSQKVSSRKNLKTKFSVVRFGNVLGSSGSVVPLFKQQLKNGGPITVTHPEITRYFMTIEEATILVLEAASFSKGGELFLLDMGEPIKIVDLATKMIKLAGYEICNSKNPNGDIKIEFTGLREGEKLFEELLIDGETIKTQNKYIFKALEPELSLNDLKVTQIEELIFNLSSAKEEKYFNLLKEIVPEWKSN